MKRFKVKTEWSGYSRGYSIYIVEAKDEEEAKDTYYEFEENSTTIRDDTENEIIEVSFLEELPTDQ